MWRQGDKEPFLILVLIPVLCLSIVVLATVVWTQNQIITKQGAITHLLMQDNMSYMARVAEDERVYHRLDQALQTCQAKLRGRNSLEGKHSPKP